MLWLQGGTDLPTPSLFSLLPNLSYPHTPPLLAPKSLLPAHTSPPPKSPPPTHTSPPPKSSPPTHIYLLGEMPCKKIVAGGGTSPPPPPLLFTIVTALLGIAGKDEHHAGRERGLEKIWERRVKEVGERSKGVLISQVDQLRNNQVSVRSVSCVRREERRGQEECECCFSFLA